MHSIKIIRDNIDLFQKKIKERNVSVNLDKLIILDKKYRETIQKKEKLENEKKSISQQRNKEQFSKSKDISKEINELAKKQTDLKDEINAIINFLPNIALDDVPIGKDEKSNKEI